MILTVDIGNTTIGLCGLERREPGNYRVVASVKLDTVPGACAVGCRRELEAALARAGIHPEALEGVAVSSVVPSLNRPVGESLRALLGRDAVWITAGSRTGLTLDVPEPGRVGLDRLVDAAWAAAHCPLPAVTVDMGTATTFNVVDEGGVFRGGIIAPGLETGLRALSAHAAQLPELALSTPDHVIGRNTEECMRSGAVAGAAAMIDGLTARIEAELGRPVSLLLTGGLARYVEPLCAHPHTYDPHLLAKGLALLYDWNVQDPQGGDSD